MFAIYISLTALVLVNLLIAMMTSRYERAKRHAECTWRFNAITFGLRVESLLAPILRRLTRLDLGPFLSRRCYPDPTLSGRYLLDVRERPTRTRLDSEQQQLVREEISRLSEQVRGIADRVDDLMLRSS